MYTSSFKPSHLQAMFIFHNCKLFSDLYVKHEKSQPSYSIHNNKGTSICAFSASPPKATLWGRWLKQQDRRGYHSQILSFIITKESNTKSKHAKRKSSENYLPYFYWCQNRLSPSFEVDFSFQESHQLSVHWFKVV